MVYLPRENHAMDTIYSDAQGTGKCLFGRLRLLSPLAGFSVPSTMLRALQALHAAIDAGMRFIDTWLPMGPTQ